MEKSDFLDELRLEVGLAYDYARNQDDFIFRVLKTIYTIVKGEAMLTIHTYEDDQYLLKYALGTDGYSKKQKVFGCGFLFLNRLNSMTYVSSGRDYVVFLPIREKDQLVYVMTIRLINSKYYFTKQDMIFAQEMIHFIEAKRKAFLK